MGISFGGVGGGASAVFPGAFCSQYFHPGKIVNGPGYNPGVFLPADLAYFMPFWVPIPATITHVGFFREDTASASTTGIAIYSNIIGSAGSTPGSRLYLQTGLDTSQGGYNENALTTPFTLTVNVVYWAAWAPNSSKNWRCVHQGDVFTCCGESPGLSNSYTHLQRIGDHSDNLPVTVDNLIYNQSQSIHLPMIVYKLSYV